MPTSQYIAKKYDKVSEKKVFVYFLDHCEPGAYIKKNIKNKTVKVPQNKRNYPILRMTNKLIEYNVKNHNVKQIINQTMFHIKKPFTRNNDRTKM